MFIKKHTFLFLIKYSTFFTLNFQKKDSSHSISCHFHLLSLTFIWHDRLVIKLKNRITSVLYPPSSSVRGDETKGRGEKKKGGEERKISFRSQTITIKMKNLRKILFRVWRLALLKSMCLAPLPPYWLLLHNLSTQLCFLSALPALDISSVTALASLAISKLLLFLLSFSSILVTLPCPPLLPGTICVIFLISVDLPMIPPSRFFLRFLCPFWIFQLSSELRKPQKVQWLISVWISTQTLDILHQFFTESLWI